MFRGIHSLDWAFQGRGTAYTDQTSRAQMELFHTRAMVAQKELHTAHKLNPADPSPFCGLIQVNMCTDGPKDEARQLLELARERCPSHRESMYAYLYRMSELWGGSDQEMMTFGLNVSSKAPLGSPLHSVLAECMLQFYMRGFKAKGMAEEGFVHFDQVYRKGIGHSAYREDRKTIYDLNMFAGLYIWGEKEELVPELFVRLGSRRTVSPWNNFVDVDKAWKRGREVASKA